jgi:cell wall-associated NlpC family hydrolase
MSVIDDITSRISALEQLFPSFASGSAASVTPDSSDTPASAGSTTSPAVAFDSELQSAMAAEADPSDSTGAVEIPGGSLGNSTGTTATTANAAIAAGTGTASPSDTSGAAVVSDAEKYLGVPYVYGGTNPATGLDCSALVQRTYADLGITLPRTSQEQSTQGTAVASLADAQPGDLVCFNSPATHIGIYIGNNQMIDAPHTGEKVQIQSITATPSAIRRIVGSSIDTTALTTTASSAVLTSRPAALGGIGSTTTGSTSPDDGSIYAAQFTAAEQKYDLPTGLLSAVAKAESDYQPDAVSSAGAVGLMQLMPATASALGVDPTNPSQSIDGAARLLQGELAKYGSVPLALAAYNAGGPAVDKYDGVPPYPQTQNYVKEIMGYLGESA